MSVQVALAAWAAFVATSDVWLRRIPNLALLAVLAPAIAVLAVEGQGLLGASLTSSLVGLVLVSGALLPGYVTRLLGGGDVKLGAVCGLVLGHRGAMEWLLMVALLLGAMAVAWIAAKRRLSSPLQRRMPAGPAMAAAMLVQIFSPQWLSQLIGSTG